MTKYEDERLKKRQYKYKEGSIVKFKPEFFRKRWMSRNIKKTDTGEVISYDRDSCTVSVIRKGVFIDKLRYLHKGKDVKLMTYEEAIMEKL